MADDNALVAILIAVLISLVGFIGNRLFNRLDTVHQKIVDVCVSHGERLSRLEVK